MKRNRLYFWLYLVRVVWHLYNASAPNSNTVCISQVQEIEENEVNEVTSMYNVLNLQQLPQTVHEGNAMHVQRHGIIVRQM